MLTTGSTKLHTFGILLADRQVASCPKPLNIAAVVRIGISRTYDNTMNNVVCELEYDPCVVIRVQTFPEDFESMSKNEMPQISVAIWASREKVFRRCISCWRLYDFSRSKRKIQEMGSELSKFLIWKAKRVRFKNVDIFVDCSDQ